MTLEIIIIVLLLICAALLVALIFKKPEKSGSEELIAQRIDLSAGKTDEKLEKLSRNMQNLTDKNYEQQIRLIETLDKNSEKQMKILSSSISELQQSNEKKLEEMRKTVNEKLDETLTARLNASFKTVSQQLTNVYKSLGEMKELSAGVTTSVTGLNRLLTNVKARGTWAEVQLGNILDETIPGMYETNVQTNPAYNGRVEFAVKIPNTQDNTTTYLPIDSKFPMEDYARLTAAAENGDAEALEASKKALEARIKDEARLIKQYISEPHTTPFAIMYLATEGLYAEVTASRTGLNERLRQDGIMTAGPSTVTALLNSLSMGFRSIAINEKANEVWTVLGAAKTQYEKFGALIVKARKKVDEAGKALDEADKRNEIIRKNLRSVETLDGSDEVLGIDINENTDE